MMGRRNKNSGKGDGGYQFNNIPSPPPISFFNMFSYGFK
jgi:hypothetical protein